MEVVKTSSSHTVILPQENAPEVRNHEFTTKYYCCCSCCKYKRWWLLKTFMVSLHADDCFTLFCGGGGGGTGGKE